MLYLILVMQIFTDFLDFANFYLVSCKVMKAVKIEFDTTYLLWGSSPKLASDSLLLVGIKSSPTGSKPSTPPVAATIAAPCCGSSRLCVAASPGWAECAGLATRRCCWRRCSAHPAVE